MQGREAEVQIAQCERGGVRASEVPVTACPERPAIFFERVKQGGGLGLWKGSGSCIQGRFATTGWRDSPNCGNMPVAARRGQKAK